MDQFSILHSYFPDLEASQYEKFERLGKLYSEWNQKINVISRKDIDHLYERHILHSLAIGKIFDFKAGSLILDAGTGGGFPGIPLAILLPEIKFHLVDSIGKKIKVVGQIAGELGINNVEARQKRVEELEGNYDFVVSRAVTRISRFYGWVSPLISKIRMNDRSNGIFYLKGGDIAEELEELSEYYEVIELKKYFTEPFFETKKLIYIPVIK